NDDDKPWEVPPEWLPLARRVGAWPRFGWRILGSLGIGRRPMRHDQEDRPLSPAQREREKKKHIKAELYQFREMCTTVDDFNGDIATRPVAIKVQGRLERDKDTPRAPHLDEPHLGWLLRLSRIRLAAAVLSGHLQPALDRAILAVFVLLGA